MADETKLMRIVEMRDRLQQGARLTIERLCRDYKVDRRTVTRDFGTLEALGMELTSERLDDGHKVWYVKSGSRRVDVRYSILDVMALFLGKRLFDFLEGTSLGERFDAVYDGIEKQLARHEDAARARSFTRKLYRIHDGPKQLTAKNLEVLDELLTGLLKEKKVALRHVSAAGDTHEVTLHPYSLVAYKRGLYALGAVEEYGGRVLTLALERIKKADFLPDDFDYPADFDPEKYFQHTPFITTGEPEPVELIFTASSAPFVTTRRYHRSQNHQKLPDGRIRMTLEIPVNFETVYWVVSFGANVEVVSPPKLREQVEAELKKAVRQYR